MHIFLDKNGDWFGCGYNREGYLHLGHNNSVHTPTRIKKLNNIIFHTHCNDDHYWLNNNMIIRHKNTQYAEINCAEEDHEIILQNKYIFNHST